MRPTKIAHGEIVRHERMLARIGDDQRLLRGHRVLTERVTQRQLAHPGQLRGQARLALDELAIRVHQRNQRNPDPQQVLRQARVAIEVDLRLGIQQTEISEGSDPRTVEHHLVGGHVNLLTIHRVEHRPKPSAA